MHRLVLCLALVTSSLAAPRHAIAAVTDFYETLDFVEINRSDCSVGCHPSLSVRGILVGGSAPVTRVYKFGASSSTDADGLQTAMHCHRLAMVVMSKPGKFQFAIGPLGNVLAQGCRLTLIAP
jgi:hypothetical protein